MTETKYGVIDLILAAAVGIAAFVFLTVWAFPGLHPRVWTETAVAAGLLPQAKMLPGFAGLIGYGLFQLLPFATALSASVWIGKALIALTGVIAYFAFSGMMEVASGSGARDLVRRRQAIRMAASTAAILLVFSSPAWMSAQGLTGATVVLFLLVCAIFFFMRLIQTASPAIAMLALFTTGLLAAESPIGWLVLVAGIVSVVQYVGKNKTEAWMDFLDPIRMQRTKWSLTFFFLAAFLFGALAEMLSFYLLDGLPSHGASAGELPVLYALAYWGTLSGGMSFVGFAAFLLVLVVPVVITTVMVPGATDEDRYLSFKFSLVYLIAVAVAFLQLSPFAGAQVWNLLGPAEISSRVAIVFAAFLSSVTVAWGLYVLGVEVFCRDYEHIEMVLYQGFAEELEEARAHHEENIESVRLTALRLTVLALPLVMAAMAVFGRHLVADRKLVGVISAFVRETLDEAKGTKYVFTDGAYDAGLRLEAKRRGQPLVPVSLMSGADRMSAYVRQLGTDGFDDRMTLEAGAAEALRTWVTSKSERLQDVSVQLAFELFRLNRKLTPLVYGALVRPLGGDAAAAAASVARCHALADVIVGLHEDGTWRHAKDEYVKDRFLFAQFRLAVMSRLRAIRHDAEKRTKESLEEIAYADKLNKNNPSLVRILRRMDWVRRQTGESLTPREGLEVAMKRADFVMARRYAMPVLMEDPDEPSANFAMGMSYYCEEQFAKAEEYLVRALKRNPDEPAIHNNLALLHLKTGRVEEAEKYATRAIELAPDIPEIKDTVQQIEKAKAQRKLPFLAPRAQ